MPPWNMQPELTLFARMRQGDEAAFAALYRLHKDAVYRFALLRTGSAAQAADVAQETFLHLITRPEQYDPSRGSIVAWLCGVARNLARRETASREDATDPEALAADAPVAPDLVDADCPAERLLASETAEQVRAALAAVAPHYRDVLILCELSDFPTPRPPRSAASTSAPCAPAFRGHHIAGILVLLIGLTVTP